MATTTIRPGLEHRHLVALKVLYLYTIFGAGVMGLWLVAEPAQWLAAFGVPESDPYLTGVVGAVWVAFGIVAVLGLRAPLRYATLVILQFAYKLVWLMLVFLPHALQGGAPARAWMLAAVFASYVVLDVIALPPGQLGTEE